MFRKNQQDIVFVAGDVAITVKEAKEIRERICNGWTGFTDMEAEAAVLSCFAAYPPASTELPHTVMLPRSQSDASGEIRNMLMAVKDRLCCIPKAKHINVGWEGTKDGDV